VNGYLSTPCFSKQIDGAQISIYDGRLPFELGADLERLYQNVFTSSAKFEADGEWGDACSYVSVMSGTIRAIFVFRRTHKSVNVLNRVFSVTFAEIDQFARAIFFAYSAVSMIRFEAVQSSLVGLGFPHQQYNCLENIVVTLPSSTTAYFGALGKNTRASLKKYQKRISAELAGFRCDIYEKGDVPEDCVRAIIALSATRITNKKMKSSHTAEKTAQLIRLLNEYGSVLVATINGRVCGGVICTYFGGNFFMHVVAHDSDYDAYRLGKVCTFLSIQAAIERGAREYHLLWGRYEYKYRLLGIQRDYDRILIYRSKLRMALNLPIYLLVALRGTGRKIRIWLRGANPHDHRPSARISGAWRGFAARLRFFG
jgi:hypothetical protein